MSQSQLEVHKIHQPAEVQANTGGAGQPSQTEVDPEQRLLNILLFFFSLLCDLLRWEMMKGEDMEV